MERKTNEIALTARSKEKRKERRVHKINSLSQGKTHDQGPDKSPGIEIARQEQIWKQASKMLCTALDRASGRAGNSLPKRGIMFMEARRSVYYMIVND